MNASSDRGPRRAARRRSSRRWAIAVGLLVVLVAGAVLFVIQGNRRDEQPVRDAGQPFAPTQAQIDRGRSLARAGNCAGCHTARGGEPYAGARAIATPFGVTYSSNLTPDRATGLGDWTPDEFWRALHNGRSRDGRLLYPTFPYVNYARVTREDADALFAYLRSLKAVAQANQPHELRFPYDRGWALAVWRALYFRPEVHRDDPARSAEWNRGAYLVEGLGHCNACHSARNVLGATKGLDDLSGGLIPVQNWYAPSLTDPREASVAQWKQEDVVALLRDGISPAGSALGPMSEVVYGSLQYLSEPDLKAMAVYLKELPPSHRASDDAAGSKLHADSQRRLERGALIYRQHCSDCHGNNGEGAVAQGSGRPAYPALAGNRTVTMDSQVNLIRVVLGGAYAPSTRGNPQPYGMPPFAHVLDDSEVAALLSYVRGSWGNQAASVTPLDVLRLRSQLDSSIE